MSEEFFERLRKKVFAQYKQDPNFTTLELAAVLGTIDATIEALKEMMVGKPIVIKPSKSVARRIFVQAIEQASTNNEKITVIILRKEPNLTK